jgi:hypothetical protein
MLETDTPEYTLMQKKPEDMTPDERWKSNDIQFPRLLSEIRALGLQEGHWDSLCMEMDITSDQLEELFTRADHAWEAIKAKTCPPPPDYRTMFFQTSGGNILNYDPNEGTWTNGCLVFDARVSDNWPLDAYNVPLTGKFIPKV